MSKEMSELIAKKRLEHQKKIVKNQIPQAVIISIITLAIAYFLSTKNMQYMYCWSFGIVFGIIIRYSRFCFAAAFRDPLLAGNTKILRAMLLALMISTVGFGFIHHFYLNSHDIIYDLLPGSVSSSGLHVAFGSLLFGIGMTIAGGCSSGVLMRIGEGHTLQFVVLLGFFIGTLLGAKTYPFWDLHFISKSSTIYFLEYISPLFFVPFQLIVLGALYYLSLLYEKNYWKNK
jgi:uncharacterized membrane protein YedE/YeeE